MRVNSIRLSNCRYRDYFYCRDKVSRAAGRRTVGSVFCSPFIKCTMTSKFRCYYRDSYVIRLYRDQTTSVHLPGLAKISPTLTRSATYYTTGPLACTRPNVYRDNSVLEFWVLTWPFYRDVIFLAHLSGPCNLDSFILTRNFSSIYLDFGFTTKY